MPTSSGRFSSARPTWSSCSSPPAQGDDLRIGLIADSGLTGLVEAIGLLFDHDERAALAQVEIALPAEHQPESAMRVLLDQLAFSATAYVEVPRRGWEGALDVLAEDGAERAKYRTGGTSADAYPSEAELAAFVSGCLDRRAGVQAHGRPAPRPSQHLRRGLRAARLPQRARGRRAASTERRPGTSPRCSPSVRRRGPRIDLGGADVAAVRRSFVSFGCCGVTDPVDDLVALGLLGDPLS